MPLRRAVVQGKLSRWGTALLLAAAFIAVLAWTEASEGAPWPVLVAGAGLLAAVGAALRMAERRLRARILAGYSEELAGREPGPSPVPWLSDAVWQAWNTVTPEDALLEERYTGAFPDPSPPPALADPRLRSLTGEEREVATRAAVEPGAPVPDPGASDEVRERLADTPGRPGALNPVWPVCCERPATALALEAGGLGPDGLPDGVEEVLYLLDADDEAGEEGPSWLRPEAGGVRVRLPDGEEAWARAREAAVLTLFQCRACGRLCVAPSWSP